MKLTSQQIQAMAGVVAKKIQEEKDARKSFFISNLKNPALVAFKKTKKFKLVQELHKLLEKDEKITLKTNGEEGSYNVINLDRNDDFDTSFLKHIYVGDKKYINTEDIKQEIIMATIECDDMNKIMDSIVKKFLSK